jgi:hypothetical protein
MIQIVWLSSTKVRVLSKKNQVVVDAQYGRVWRRVVFTDCLDRASIRSDRFHTFAETSMIEARSAAVDSVAIPRCETLRDDAFPFAKYSTLNATLVARA